MLDGACPVYTNLGMCKSRVLGDDDGTGPGDSAAADGLMYEI